VSNIRVAVLIHAISLAAAAAGLPERLDASIGELTRIREPDTWTLGSHALLGRELHDALVAADTLLPPDAVVLLVTPGSDIRRSEYVAFHRALYVLSPRPVWWAAPAVRDGTWESRWWTEITPSWDAALAEGRRAGATHVLSLDGNVRVAALDSASATGHRETEWRAAPAPAGAIAGLILILLTGWVIHAILARRGEPASLARTAAMSWLFGCAALSLAMFWMIRLGVTPAAQRIAIGAAAVAGSFRIMRRRGLKRMRSGVDSRSKVSGRVEAILTAGLGLWLVAEMTGLLLRSAAGPLAGWDGWVTWGMKARMLHLQHDSTSLLMDASREIANRSYPLLLPLTESWIFGWIGAADDRFAAMVTLGFLVSILVLLLSELRSRMGLVFALAVVIAFVTTPYAGLLASLGYADAALGAYALAAALAMKKWIENPDTSVAVAASLVGILPWVKAEGFILGAALLIGACVSLRISAPRRRFIGFAAIVALVCAGPWYLLVATSDISVRVFSRYPHLTAGRAREIAVGFASRAIAIEWHFLWLVAAAAMAIILAKRRWRALLPVAITVYVAALAFAFLFSLYEPLDQHVLSSADRLLLHVAPLALVMIADVMGSPRRGPATTATPREDYP
jgi:hypothetical protein